MGVRLALLVAIVCLALLSQCCAAQVAIVGLLLLLVCLVLQV
jgi:hypothetical protein